MTDVIHMTSKGPPHSLAFLLVTNKVDKLKSLDTRNSNRQLNSNTCKRLYIKKIYNLKSISLAYLDN